MANTNKTIGATIFEADKQTDDTASELISSSQTSSPPLIQNVPKINPADLGKLEEKEKKKTEEEIAGLRGMLPGARNVEEEMQEVRIEKKEKEEKNKEEEEFLANLKKQREEEQALAASDAVDPLAETGYRVKRGSASAVDHGTGEKPAKKF